MIMTTTTTMMVSFTYITYTPLYTLHIAYIIISVLTHMIYPSIADHDDHGKLYKDNIVPLSLNCKSSSSHFVRTSILILSFIRWTWRPQWPRRRSQGHGILRCSCHLSCPFRSRSRRIARSCVHDGLGRWYLPITNTLPSFKSREFRFLNDVSLSPMVYNSVN